MALRDSNILHCLSAIEGSLEKNCRSIHAVTERMAAPGCGSGRAKGAKLWFNHISMSWPLKKVQHKLHFYSDWRIFHMGFTYLPCRWMWRRKNMHNQNGGINKVKN